MLYCTYADLTDDDIADLADRLAWEMDNHQVQYSLREMDATYRAMDRTYDRHIKVLQSRGWTLDHVSTRIHCPVW